MDRKRKTTDRQRKHQRRERLFIFCELPQCPDCDSTEFDIDGGTVRTDSGKRQYASCRQCGAAVLIHWEPPEADPTPEEILSRAQEIRGRIPPGGKQQNALRRFKAGA